MTKIAVFVGSLQEKSFNKMLAKNLESVVPAGAEFDYIDLNIPLFNQDLVADYPAQAQAIKDAVEAADGVLFVTPEYNRGIPGVLKNAIDWASQPYGHNSFDGKPAGMVGATIGPVGTAVAQSNLRHTLVYLGMRVMGQPEIYLANCTSETFDQDGVLVDERWRKNLTGYMAAFTTWVTGEK